MCVCSQILLFLYSSKQVSDGAGVALMRAVGMKKLDDQLDPFLMLDHISSKNVGWVGGVKVDLQLSVSYFLLVRLSICLVFLTTLIEVLKRSLSSKKYEGFSIKNMIFFWNCPGSLRAQRFDGKSCETFNKTLNILIICHSLGSSQARWCTVDDSRFRDYSQWNAW